MTGLARVWLGVHFLSDVAAGLLLGALLLALHPRLANLAAKSWSWAGLTFACALSAGWNQSSALAGLATFSLGLTLGMMLPLPRTTQTSWRTPLLALLGGLPLGRSGGHCRSG